MNVTIGTTCANAGTRVPAAVARIAKFCDDRPTGFSYYGQWQASLLNLQSRVAGKGKFHADFMIVKA